MGLIIGTGFVFATGRSQQAAAAKPTLVFGIQGNAFISDYDNNYLTQYLEKHHNINIDVYMLPNDPVETRTNVALMAASGDLPDALFVESLTEAQIYDYGSKGAFIPLNRYLNDPAAAPNFTAISAGDKAIMLNAMTSADGNIYGLANYAGPVPWNETPHRIYLNRVWLSKLGLKPPTTTDELRSVLLAFRDGDPNGNGRKDEIGILGWYNGGLYGEPAIISLINSFVFLSYDHSFELTLDASGNTVTAPFTDPAFRKALVYLNTLYKDGVLAADTFTVDQQTYRSILNANPAVVGFTTAGSVGNWPDSVNNPNFLEMAPILEPLTGPDGVSWTPYNPTYPAVYSFITSKSKTPDLVFKVLDSFYNEEIALAVMGEEGVDWTRDPSVLAGAYNEEVEAGLYPAVTVVTLTDLWATLNNKTWHGLIPAVRQRNIVSGSLTRPVVRDSGLSPDAGVSAGALNRKYYASRHPEHILLRLKFNEADLLRVTEPQVNVRDYVKQSIAEFTIGTRDINNDAAWNAYLRDLDNMGLKIWLEAAQATYNRQR
jgi:putative aldouronate transport system substrate-binding protein